MFGKKNNREKGECISECSIFDYNNSSDCSCYRIASFPAFLYFQRKKKNTGGHYLSWTGAALCHYGNARGVLPETDIIRSFVIVDKVKNTSKKYPRKAGLPTKEPLGQ